MPKPRHATRKKPTKAFQLNTAALQYLGKLTRYHLIALSIAACSLVLGAISTFSPSISSPKPGDGSSSQLTATNDSASAGNRKLIKLALNDTGKPTTAIHELPKSRSIEDPDFKPNNSLNLENPKAAPTILSERVVTRTIKPGDNLSNIFLSVGLSAKDVYQITSLTGKQGTELTKMFPGEKLEFRFSPDQSIKQITRVKSALESIHFNATDNGASFQASVERRTPEIRQVHRSGTVEHSLSLAADNAALSPTLTMNMANIFGGVIDFVYDVRSGDQFTVIFEEHYLDGKKIDEGNIIAAQYINRGKAYNAFRYVHNNGEIGYYNEEGVSMRKAFLRAPLDFTRVSSGFNLKRLHPITKKVKPHRGIDYAAPTGTPVFSVGEGRVIASGYSNANGKYVFVKHGEAYTTKYLHLSRRTVKKGQRVKQGQIIGHVGCTGLCTGPHLHYEFLVNGVHRNPRTIVKRLPKAKRLAKAELPAFTQATLSSQEMLRSYSQQLELASNQ